MIKGSARINVLSCSRFLIMIRTARGSQFCKFCTHLSTFYCKHMTDIEFRSRIYVYRVEIHGATSQTWIKAIDIMEKVGSL